MSRKIVINHNQLTLPFGKTVSLEYEDGRKAFWFLALVSVLSLAVYFYGINATAHNVSFREESERKVAELNVTLATLEFQYIALRNEVTLDTAREFGLAEIRKPLFIARDRS